MKKEILFSENRGAFSPVRDYTFWTSSEKYEIVEKQPSGQEISVGDRWLQSTRLTLRQIFLPYGYPQSVSKDYVTYQLWDTAQAFASSITGALATEAVMKGVGVGNENATPLAAALTWLLKSGSGHIGQIAFAWAKGTSLDYDCKKWRLFADGLNDFATFIDLISPLFPTNMVVFVLCSSSVARALVGVAGSATRAAVTQHQARQNNNADVSAKDGSQETLVNLVALITSLIMLPMVSGNTMAVWLLYLTFTFVHVFGNYKAVTALQLETFNGPRILLCLKDYLTTGSVSSIQNINSRESVVLGYGLKEQDVCGFHISFGRSLDSVLTDHSEKKKAFIERLVMQSNSRPFLIIPNTGKRSISIILHENSQPNDVIEALVRSIFLGIVLSQNTGTNKTEYDSHSTVCLSLSSMTSSGDICDANPMDRIITKEWENFKRLAKSQGFVFDRALLNTGDWRAKWLHS